MTSFLFAGLIVLMAVSLAGFALVVAQFLGWTSWRARVERKAAQGVEGTPKEAEPPEEEKKAA
jgi:uncharacterized iron-regulated membrane protein